MPLAVPQHASPSSISSVLPMPLGRLALFFRALHAVLFRFRSQLRPDGPLCGCLPFLTKRLSPPVRVGALVGAASFCLSPTRIVSRARCSSCASLSCMDDSFIKESLVRQASLSLIALAELKLVQDLNRRQLARATHQTKTVMLLISGNHRERIQMYLIPSSASPAILGSPWLATKSTGRSRGASLVTLTVCALLSRLRPRLPLCHLPLQISRRCRMSIMTWGRCSPSNERSLFFHTARMIAPLNCDRVLRFTQIAFTICPDRSARRWKGT